MTSKTVSVRLWEPIGTTRIRTTDAKFYTGTGDPLPPQARAVKKSQVLDRWRFRDGQSRDAVITARTRDTVLSTPTPAENAAWSARMATMSGYDGGLLWQGDLQPVGKAVAAVVDALRRVKGAARQKDALSQAVVALADFGNDLGNSEADRGPAGTLAFGHATPEDVQKANDEYWRNNSTRASAMDSAGQRGLSTRATADSINAANRAFYAPQPTHRREWGKG
jgi:hypothetical protein